MRVILILSVTIFVVQASLNVEEEWNSFKVKHGKTYKSLMQERLRKNIFIANLKKITEHNKLFEEDKVTYSLKVNHLADMATEEVNALLNGYKKKSDLKDSKLNGMSFVPPPNAEIPETLDWRESGAVTPVKDQGRCGSCWSFSSTGALEGQLFLKTGKLVSISEQNLVDCSHDNRNAGCNGGYMQPAFQYVTDNDGIDSEDSYPYEGVNNVCRYTLAGNVTSNKAYSEIAAGSEDDLKAAVATVGPIAVAIDASNNDFHLYSSGIYYNARCLNGINDVDELDHAVLLVGYGTENGQDYWLVKNSWAADWGDGGYIKMARNRDNNCGIASDASFPVLY